MCAPSRTAFFTGRHSGQFLKHRLSGTVIDAKQNVSLVSSLLRDAGYATAAVGKIAPLSQPLQQGFDAFFGQVSQTACHNMYPRVYDSGDGVRNFNLTLNWKAKSRELCMAHASEYNYTVDLTTSYALDWLHRQGREGSGEQPFFLYLSYTIPHAGGWSDIGMESGAPVPTDSPYHSHTSWPDVERDHAAVITYLDDQVGLIFDALDKMGIDEDTLVFFAR